MDIISFPVSRKKKSDHFDCHDCEGSKRILQTLAKRWIVMKYLPREFQINQHIKAQFSNIYG